MKIKNIFKVFMMVSFSMMSFTIFAESDNLLDENYHSEGLGLAKLVKLSGDAANDCQKQPQSENVRTESRNEYRFLEFAPFAEESFKKKSEYT